MHVNDPAQPTIVGHYIQPPFSILDRRKGEWRKRTQWWRTQIPDDAEGRSAPCNPSKGIMSIGDGTSRFDPTIAEIFYRWWTRKGDHIIDPFSGGPTRGLIAEKMGRKYTGIDIRPEQIAANRQYGDHWEIGDATHWSPPPADAIFTCPPYLGLERYSDNPHDLSNMGLEDYDTAIHAAIANTMAALRNHRYIGIVISDVRGKDGNYQRLPDLIRTALATSGCHIVNSLIVVDPVGKKYLTGWKLLGQSRKVQRTHQELIIAVKGDNRTAAQRLFTPDMHHTPSIGKEPE